MELLQPLVPVRLAAKNDGLLVVFQVHLRRLLGHVASTGRSFALQDMQQYLVTP